MIHNIVIKDLSYVIILVVLQELFSLENKKTIGLEALLIPIMIFPYLFS